jgi:hypothetical protein
MPFTSGKRNETFPVLGFPVDRNILSLSIVTSLFSVNKNERDMGLSKCTNLLVVVFESTLLTLGK